MISLRKLDWDMFDEFMKLDVNDSQKNFVAPCLISLAEAYMHESNQTADTIINIIYSDDTIIGYALIFYKQDGENRYYDLHRYMIDQRYQGKGYGKEAFSTVMDYIKQQPFGKANKIVLEYNPSNTVAKHVYHSYGFQDTDHYNKYGEVLTEYYL